MRLAIIATLVSALSGCVGSATNPAHSGYARAQTPAEWSSSQQVKLQQLLHGTPYVLTEVNGGWLIRIAEKDTFNPHRPELLLPAALGNIGQITRHLAQDPDVAVMVVGVATGKYKLKSKEQVSEERAQSVASIFRLNRVPGHRLRTLGVSQGEQIDTHLGVALLVVPEQELHHRAAEARTQVVAMLNRN